MRVSARTLATLAVGVAVGTGVALPVSAMATSDADSPGSQPGMERVQERMQGDGSSIMDNGPGMMGGGESGGDMMGMHQQMMRMMRENPEMVEMCNRMMDRHQGEESQ